MGSWSCTPVGRMFPSTVRFGNDFLVVVALLPFLGLALSPSCGCCFSVVAQTTGVDVTGTQVNDGAPTVDLTEAGGAAGGGTLIPIPTAVAFDL